MLGVGFACWTRCGKRRAGDWIGGSSGSTSPGDCAADRYGAAATFAGDFAVSHRADRPCRTRADHSGLFAEPVGLCGGAHDWRDAANLTRCLERAAELGVIEALDDRPRAGRDPVIAAKAKTWLVALACRKARELGYPHELWTTRLLAAHARQHGPAAGHPSLGKLAQGTVCKILAEHEVKPHKVRYYLEQ